MKQLTARLIVTLFTSAFGIGSATLWLVSYSHPPNGRGSQVPSRQAEIQVPGAQAGETPKLFQVSRDGKTGFIDKTGKLIIPLKFPLPYVQGDFSDGMARIAVEKEGPASSGTYWRRFGYINAAGEVAIPPQFDEAEDFSEGLAVVRINDRYVFIDRAGRIAIQERFLAASGFSEGLAGVRKESGDRGFIDRTGRVIIDGYSGKFSEGLAAVMNQKLEVSFIDKAGRVVFEYGFVTNGYYDFSDGLLPVSVDRKMGFIDKTGRRVIEPVYNSAYPFSDGMARVMVCEKENCEFGFLDKSGRMVIEPQYADAGDFSEGLAPVEIKGRWGYIDKTGRVVIKPRFDFAGEFTEGIAPVMTGAVYADVPQTGIKNGYIDRTGKYVWRPSS